MDAGKPVIVIASHNQAKSREIAAILEQGLNDLSAITRLLADYEGAAEPEENGSTYAENALIKATACAKFTGEIAFADDAGLEIDFLNGQPGLFSRRFAGESTPFPQKMAIILEQMENTTDAERTARFRCAVAIALPNGHAETYEATCEGIITRSPRGNGGFGYDPIFYLPRFGCTMAELPPEFKNRISHRAQVMMKAIPALRALITGDFHAKNIEAQSG